MTACSPSLEVWRSCQMRASVPCFVYSLAGGGSVSMITYSLRCHRSHEFDGWFRNSAAFEEQSAKGLLGCPCCDSIRIEKAIMAPAVSGTKKSTQPNAA